MIARQAGFLALAIEGIDHATLGEVEAAAQDVAEGSHRVDPGGEDANAGGGQEPELLLDQSSGRQINQARFRRADQHVRNARKPERKPVVGTEIADLDPQTRDGRQVATGTTGVL